MRNFIVTIEGKRYEVNVEEVVNGAVVEPVVTQVQQAPVATAPVAQKPTQPAPQKAPTSVSGTKLEAPMPGMIKAFKVSEGATVKEGDVVLVLEAMKMDNDITAPCDGVISFKTQVGANVETGTVMATIS